MPRKRCPIIRLLSFFLLLPILPLALQDCAGGQPFPATTAAPGATQPPYQPQDAAPGTLSVDLNTVINPDVIGPGINFDFCYTADMNLQTGTGNEVFPNTAGMSDTDAQTAWDAYFKLIDYMDFKYVRFMVSPTLWEPVNDNGDPLNTDFDSGFVFSPNYKQAHPEVSENNYLYMDAMIKLLDHFQQTGKYVIIANWGRGDAGFCPNGDNWLSDKRPDGTSYDWSGDPGLHLTSVDELTESLGALLDYLIVDKGYTCVKGVSLWNEPEGLGDYQNDLVSLYNSMGQQLTRLGIRDKCLIQAYDGVIFYSVNDGWDMDRISEMAPLCGDNMDIIALHDYFGRMDYMTGGDDGATHGTFAGFSIPSLWQPALTQSSAGGKARPVVMSEMGTFEFGGSDTTIPADFPLQLSNAEMMARGFNLGVSGFGLWIFNLPYQPYFTMLNNASGGAGAFTPDGVNYYPSSLLCKYIAGGASIVSSTVGGCTDSNGAARVYATVAKSDDEVTVLLVNDNTRPASLAVSGLTAGTYHNQYVCEGQTDGIYADAAFTPDANGEGTVYLRPQSITVLTTYPGGTQTIG